VVDQDEPYSLDAQRVADWLVTRMNGLVGAGDDPISFVLASYEHMHAELLEARKLWQVCEQFVTDQNISCAETVYQTDRVIENAYAFIEQVCDVVGYVNMEDEA
jgi:hypothetical protein